ncbi:hypothetical protein IAU60_000493 [Kwoniella sp. DSM 27419]
MCTEYACSLPSSSRFICAHTPPALHFDQVSTHDGSVSEQETVLESPSDLRTLDVFPVSLAHDANGAASSINRRAKRPASPRLLTPALSPTHPPVRKRSKMEMHMAEKGTVSAMSAFQTPLATYVAQMVVWLWYGDFPPSHSVPTSPLASMVIQQDPFEVSENTTSRITPLMVQPSSEFSKFVARLLSVTSVSHSVTLLALFYIYRLKTRNQIYSTPGSEQRPFVAGLMLANKYLDDNTYTNSTWSDLAGMPLPDINHGQRMETEFLVGLDYNLNIELGQFHQWKKLLDEFMTSRLTAQYSSRHSRQISVNRSPLNVYTPTSPLASQSYLTSRARSASPPRILPPPHADPYAFPTTAEYARKRSAVDAFAYEQTAGSDVYESVRMPTRKAAFNQPLHQALPSMVHPRPAGPQQSTTSSLARSSSLNRRHARLGSHLNAVEGYTRRGSAGHVIATPVTGMGQLSPIGHDFPVAHATRYQQWDGGRALLAPCQYTQSKQVPPEHLMFYSLAAEAHPGVDGAPRKAILRYQENNGSFGQQPYVPVYPHGQMSLAPPSMVSTPYTYDEASVQEANSSPLSAYPPAMYPHQAAQPSFPSAHPIAQGIYDPSSAHGWNMPYRPEPAQFANAGPPGFSYMPNGSMPWKHGDMSAPANGLVGLGFNTYSQASTPGLAYTSGQMSYPAHDEMGLAMDGMKLSPAAAMQWSSKSEWSSPAFPRYA